VAYNAARSPVAVDCLRSLPGFDRNIKNRTISSRAWQEFVMPPPSVKLSMSIYFYKKTSFLLAIFFFWQIYVLFLLRFQLEKADKAQLVCSWAEGRVLHGKNLAQIE